MGLGAVRRCSSHFLVRGRSDTALHIRESVGIDRHSPAIPTETTIDVAQTVHQISHGEMNKNESVLCSVSLMRAQLSAHGSATPTVSHEVDANSLPCAFN